MGSLLQEIPEDSHEEDDEQQQQQLVAKQTPYEKILQFVHDPKFSHEVALEKRVGLYKFCGKV